MNTDARWWTLAEKKESLSRALSRVRRDHDVKQIFALREQMASVEAEMVQARVDALAADIAERQYESARLTELRNEQAEVVAALSSAIQEKADEVFALQQRHAEAEFERLSTENRLTILRNEINSKTREVEKLIEDAAHGKSASLEVQGEAA